MQFLNRQTNSIIKSEGMDVVGDGGIIYETLKWKI